MRAKSEKTTKGRISPKAMLIALAESRIGNVVVVGTRGGYPFIAQSGASKTRADIDATIEQLKMACGILRTMKRSMA